MKHDLQELIRELASWAEDDPLGLIVALLDTRQPPTTSREMMEWLLRRSKIATSKTAVNDARKRTGQRLRLIANKCVCSENEAIVDI